MDKTYLAHYGILGMHWGIRRFQPYPKGHKKGKEVGKASRVKKALVVGGITAAGVLAAYGGYKLYSSGILDKNLDAGREYVKRYRSNSGSLLSSLESIEPVGAVKRLSRPETIEECLKNTNPNRGRKEYENNCTASAVSGILRTMGIDVIAPTTGGKMQNLNGMVEEIFKFKDENDRRAHVKDGYATVFGRSPDEAAGVLVRKFGQNASGVCSIVWRGSDEGHAFSWRIQNGIVQFFCPQTGLNDQQVRSSFWPEIDVNGALQMARIDDLEINPEGFKKLFG